MVLCAERSVVRPGASAVSCDGAVERGAARRFVGCGWRRQQEKSADTTDAIQNIAELLCQRR